jgi:hypothetical protein
MTIVGIVLAILLVWEGLYMRLFLDVWNAEPPWLKGINKLGFDPFNFAWPLIVLGISWISALCGLWLKLPWGRWVLWIVSILSLLYVEIGTILSGLVLVGMILPGSQRWIKGSHASEAE